MIDQKPVFLLHVLNNLHLARGGKNAEGWLGWAKNTRPVEALLPIHRFSQLLRASIAFDLEVEKNIYLSVKLSVKYRVKL
jgi:hypothetical protein